ncbi:MAG: class I SAM-dependent methyltransferase [Firmicutes bacterium]|nr:class I SAM-dependent methyltransferase [Bacillota bacterium]
MAKTEPFDNYTFQYEEWFEQNKIVFESELLAIKRQMPECFNGIEIGAGSGQFAAPLGIKIGVEPSGKMREIAQKRGIEVIDGIAESLPFEDSQFDLALMTTTVCFIDDVDKSFKEAYRVLKSGGVFIIGFIDKESPIGKLYQRHKEENVFYRLATFRTVDEVVSILKKAGFQSFNFSQTIFHNISVALH